MDVLKASANRLCAVEWSGVDELHAHVVADRGIEETADWIAELAVADVRGADFAVLVVADRAPPASDVVAATDPLALHLHDVERAAGHGPGLEALRTGVTSCVVRTTDPDVQWNGVRAACVEQGVMSFVAVPLTAAGHRLGWITLYSDSVDAFTPVRVAQAVEFAAAAGVVLTNAVAYWSARSRADSLGVALESRATIDQAKGMVMQALSCSPDQAFRVLVEQSQFEQRKLRDIARELVERTGGHNTCAARSRPLQNGRPSM